MQSKWHVTNFFTVEVEAEDAVTAEAKVKSIVPSTSQIQGVGAIVRTQWAVEWAPFSPKEDTNV